MKKLILIILVVFASCNDKDIIEQDCGCVKTTFYYKDLSTQYIEHIDTYIVSVENVKCTEDVFKKPMSQQYLFYTIKCKN